MSSVSVDSCPNANQECSNSSDDQETPEQVALANVDITNQDLHLNERVRSLPAIVCRSASGDSFLVHLTYTQAYTTHKLTPSVSDVQKTMLRKRLGDQCHDLDTLLRKFTSKTVLDYKKLTDGYPDPPDLNEPRRPTSRQKLLPDDFFLADPEVIYRLNRTVRYTERVRESYNNAREELAEFVLSVEQDIDDESEEADTSFEALDERIAEQDDCGFHSELHSTDVERCFLPSLSTTAKSRQRRARRILGQLSDAAAQTKAEKLFSFDDIKMRTNQNTNNGEELEISGAGLYEVRCNSLLSIPLTRVIKGLNCQQCCLDHTRLACDGADALGKSLSINNIITNLSLVDCALDAKSVGYIVEGLRSGTDDDAQQYRDLAASLSQAPLHGRSLKKHGHPQNTSVEHRPGSVAVGNLLGEDIRRLKQAAAGSHHRKRSSVTKLDLSENPLGVTGARWISTLLDPVETTHQSLVELVLRKSGLMDDGALSLIRAIQNGNTCLTKLDLSANALTNKTAAAIGELFECNHTLTDLNLSWNNIKAAGASSLAKGLMTNGSLQILDLSWNGLENEGVLPLGEMLSINLGLKCLNLMNTRTGAEGSLVLAEGLKANNTLERIFLDGNPIGEFGARHLMHAISQNKCLKFLGLQGSNMSATVSEGDADSAKFNPLYPDGSYELDLNNQTDRTVAQQLCQLNGPHSLSQMRNAKLNGKEIQPKNMDWPNRLPTQGILKLDYVSQSLRKVVSVIDNKKINALATQFSNTSMTDAERLGIIHVSAPYHFYLCRQIRHILERFGMGDERLEAATVLFTRAVDTDENLSLLLSPLHEREQKLFQRQVAYYRCYVFSNPTGHYELNLTIPLHRLIANRLKDCAYSEEVGPVWKNIVYDEYSKQLRLSSNYGPPEQWKSVIPTIGTLSFDYVSGEPIPEDVEFLTPASLRHFLENQVQISFDQETAQPICTTDSSIADTQIMKLRRQISNRFLTSEALRSILRCFELGPYRAEAVVCCYANLVDRDQFWAVLNDLRGLEQAIVLLRLGPLSCFSPLHVSMHWILDVANPDHEEVAKKLVKLALSDTELPNFWNIRLNGRRRQITENGNLWAVLTTDTFTPFLEFDFIGSDSWSRIFGLMPEDLAAMSTGEKLEHRKKHAARIETMRIRQMYGYFRDRSGYHASEWQTRAALMKPLLEKPPWIAAWDRQLRRLLRLSIRLGEVHGASSLEDLFEEVTDAADYITTEEFLELMKSMGHAKHEIESYAEILKRENQRRVTSDQSAIDTAEEPLKSDNTQLDFKAFVMLFMTEPSRIQTKENRTCQECE